MRFSKPIGGTVDDLQKDKTSTRPTFFNVYVSSYIGKHFWTFDCVSGDNATYVEVVGQTS